MCASRVLLAVCVTSFVLHGCTQQHGLTGELRKWHKITLTFDGPATSETSNPNPFLDYRLNVRFSNNAKSYLVPGYFAADGNAAETSSSSGNKWRVHFCPDDTGTWVWSVSFRKGSDIAVHGADTGESAGHMDGMTGSIDVGLSNKSGRDHRSKGRLQYVGKHYLRFSETGEYFLKAGADAPENILAYADFDGDFKSDGYGDKFIKTWQPHVRDWRQGDPVWQGEKGKGIIGALNYLASKGMNAFSFLTLSLAGDDHNVFPYLDYDERLRMDVSRLDQWEKVFEHADKLGLYLHFKTQEAENQGLLDQGELGRERKLYYRELIARFGHHLALNWNLGEENGEWMRRGHPTPAQTTAQRKAMARYFRENDPYGHHIVIHNGAQFDDMLGEASQLTGISLQTNMPDFSNVHQHTLNWINKSASAGKPWVVAVDEPGDHRHALVPDKDDPGHDNARKNALWGALMAGAAGIEWYFGYEHDHSDLTCQDWRSRDAMWDQCRYALSFFKENAIPFWQMQNGNNLLTGVDGYCLYKPGEVYLVYLKQAGTGRLDLSDAEGTFTMRWYNPRTGEIAAGSRGMPAGNTANIGPPPDSPDRDWLCWLQAQVP